MNFHIPDTPKSKSRNNVSFKKENEEEDTKENKKYRIRLSDEEIKPPIREREVDFEDYMVRNIDIIMTKLEGLENENRGLKSKLENTDIIMTKLEGLENENRGLKSKLENTDIIMTKLEGLENENRGLKIKFENMNNDFLQLTTSIENMTKALYNKSLSYEEKLRKIEKIQEENPHKIRIERISSDGIARYTHKDGTLVCFV